jgi:hypothetical protein
LTDRYQVLIAQAAPFPTGFYGTPQEIPFAVFGQGGHVCIRFSAGGYGAFYGGLLITASRPVWSLVNDLDSTTGPQADTDTLEVDIDYASAAGHIEAWHNFPARLQAAAAGNLQATQQMAALEFTRQALMHGPEPHDTFGFDSLFGLGGNLIVINA